MLHFFQNHSVITQTRSRGYQPRHQHPFFPLLLWCYGQRGPLHRVALMSIFFFHITVKSVFVCRAECCCNMERKHRLTPPCEHTPTFQPEQSRIKKEVCAARESPDSCLVLPILLPAPLIHPSPLTSYSPSACRLEKNTAVGMQL